MLSFTSQEARGQIFERATWAGAALLLVTVATWIATNVRRLGFRFEAQTPVELDYALAVVWWLVLAVGLLVVAGEAKQMLFVAWVGKFFVVLVAMLVYEHGYGLDAMDYQLTAKTGDYPIYQGIDFREQSKIPSLQPLKGSDGRPMGGIGTENFIRIVMAVAAITGPFYHVLKVVFAFFGLLGIWFFYQALVVILGYPFPVAFYGLAFFPSIIFWSSILGKDPLQFLFLGLYAYGVTLWFSRGLKTALWPLAMGLFGAYILRPWMCAMAIAALACSFLLGGSGKARGILIVATGAATLFLFEEGIISTLNLQDKGGGVVGYLSTEVIVEALESSARGMAQVTQSSGGSGAAELADIASGGGSQVSLSWAIFSGLFRPLPYDVTNAATGLAAMENSIVLCLSVVALLRLRLAYLFHRLVLWLASFGLIWALVYGFIVMANFGSGARYKLQVWPFLLMLLFLLVSRRGREVLDSGQQERAHDYLPRAHSSKTS